MTASKSPDSEPTVPRVADTRNVSKYDQSNQHGNTVINCKTTPFSPGPSPFFHRNPLVYRPGGSVVYGGRGVVAAAVAPTVPADADEYVVRITVRGDELHIPFRVHSGRDYAIGEDLYIVAERIAHDVVNGRYSLGEDATVFIQSVPDPEEGCAGDNEPIPLAQATVYAR